MTCNPWYTKICEARTIIELPLSVAYIQSITVPLQGFLNAIVYGWTGENFLHVMARGVITEAEQLNNETARVEVEDSGILSSIENSERSLASSIR